MTSIKWYYLNYIHLHTIFMIEPASKKPAKRQALTPFILQLFLVLPLSPHLDLHWLTGPHIFSCGDQIYHIKNSS